jgi:hypothetical protein
MAEKPANTCYLTDFLSVTGLEGIGLFSLQVKTCSSRRLNGILTITTNGKINKNALGSLLSNRLASLLRPQGSAYKK